MESVEGVTSSMEKLSIQSNRLSEDFWFKEILPKLPVKSLMRFKCVSKDWLAQISSKSFIADHVLQHRCSDPENPLSLGRGFYRDDKEEEEVTRAFLISHGESINIPVEIDRSYVTKAQPRSEEIRTFYFLGSCNGLVIIKLVYTDGQTLLLLWNPTTREFRNLPKPIAPTLMPGMFLVFNFYSIGFGKDGSDYKLLQISESKTNDETVAGTMLHFQIYTKSSGFWRQIKVLSGLTLLAGRADAGVVIGGAIHWSLLRGETPAKGSLFKILTFDLDSEEFKEIDGPATQSNDDYVYLKLVKWKGSLGAVMATHGIARQFWLKSNGLSWTTMLTMEPCVWLKEVLVDLFIVVDYNCDPSDCDLFDPVTKRKRAFDEVYGSNIFCYDFIYYQRSLVSPN